MSYTRLSTVAACAAALLSSPVMAEEYTDLPDNVVHFPLHRTQPDVIGIFRRNADDTVDVTMENLVTYFSSELQMGSDKQSVVVQIDTGSSDLWVMDSSNPYCSSSTSSTISSGRRVNCSSSSMFDPSSSSSFNWNNTDFSINYGDSSFANGSYAYDNIVIGGKTVQNANFAVANQTNSTTAVWGIGLLGSEAVVDTINTDGSFSPTYPNIPLQMKNQGIISQNAYSLWLNDVNAEEGSLLFGGVDHAKYTGTLQTVPLLSTIRGTQPNTFTVALSDLSLYQGTNSAVIASMKIGALLDSGSSFTSLPSSVVDAVLQTLGGSYTSGYVIVPCASSGGLTFDIAGIKVDVPFSQMMFQLSSVQCILGIIPDNTYTILGDTFLRSVYSVYDIDSLEIALAPVVYNATDSNVEAITSGIPSASQAPEYSSTNTSSVIYTTVPKFYVTGSRGASYGDYPSGSATATSTSIVSGSDKNSTGTATSKSATSSSKSTSTSSSSRSKNEAVRQNIGLAGIFGAVGGLLMLL